MRARETVDGVDAVGEIQCPIIGRAARQQTGESLRLGVQSGERHRAHGRAGL